MKSGGLQSCSHFRGGTFQLHGKERIWHTLSNVEANGIKVGVMGVMFDLVGLAFCFINLTLP